MTPKDYDFEDMPLVAALEARAAASPDKDAVVFVDGDVWTWSELRARAQLAAAHFAALGVAQGDRVVGMLPNGPLGVLAFFALPYLGAVFVPINTAYRGQQLQHVLRNSGARLMLVEAELLDRLVADMPADITRILVNGDARPELAGIDVRDARELAEPIEVGAMPLATLNDWDMHLVIYTSGTTGPSKGVCCSYRHIRTASLGSCHLRRGDRSMAQLPLFHMGGIYGYLWALHYDGAVIVADRFRTDRFWEIVRSYRVNVLGLLGAMVDFLNEAPPDQRDRDNPLTAIVAIPYGPAAQQFGQRFGVDVYTAYTMTELAMPLFAGPNPPVQGTCGIPGPGYDLRIVDDNDEEVPDGQPGELVVRMERPWTMSHAYLEDPANTAKAWRNGWFHTGDVMRKDEQGHFHFVDRTKDCIRRRGENISSFEVECALLEHPDVIEAAVVGVPAPESSEQEVLAVLRLARGMEVAELHLHDFLRHRLATYARPRFVRVVDDLPRTPTHKIAKVELRKQGLTADVFDFGIDHTRR